MNFNLNEVILLLGMDIFEVLSTEDMRKVLNLPLKRFTISYLVKTSDTRSYKQARELLAALEKKGLIKRDGYSPTGDLVYVRKIEGPELVQISSAKPTGLIEYYENERRRLNEQTKRFWKWENKYGRTKR